MIRIRVKCTACGMLGSLKKLKEPTPSFKVYVQEIGGRLPGRNPDTGKPIGKIKYTEIFPMNPSYEAAKRLLIAKLERALVELRGR